MSTHPLKQPEVKTGTTRTLLVTLGDTTWRMLIPSAILVALGIFGDLRMGTKPWLTLAGVLLGLAASAALIRQQLGRIQ